MLQNGAILGGEQSGHIIFLNHSTTGDGLLTSLQLMRIIQEEKKPLSVLATVMQKYPQIMLNFQVKKKELFFKNKNIQEILREIEKELDRKGRIFIRPSGTESLIRVLLEGEDKDRLKKISHKLSEVFQKEELGDW